jgi:hypothetical protein
LLDFPWGKALPARTPVRDESEIHILLLRTDGGQFCPTILQVCTCKIRLLANAEAGRRILSMLQHALLLLEQSGRPFVVTARYGTTGRSYSRLTLVRRSCLRKSSQNARRFFFTANAARVIFPWCACRAAIRKSCSNRQIARDFSVRND